MRRSTLALALLAAACTEAADVSEPMASTAAPVISWVDDMRLVADDAATDQHFGTSVDTSVDAGVTTAVIGAPNRFTNTSPGAAYVFVLDDGAWTQQQKLTASDGASEDYFGDAVSVSGDTLVVGAPDYGDNGPPGAAYVFVRSGDTWAETQKLTGSDALAGHYFGEAVALQGDSLFVGAPALSDAGDENGNGAVYVFERTGGVFTETQKLVASDGDIGDTFGNAIALDGSWVVVGARWEGDPPRFNWINFGPGAVYFFEDTGSTWVERQKLRSAVASGLYGERVALDGSTALIGNENAHAAFVVENLAGTWVETQQLEQTSPVPGMFGDRFGWAVAAADGVLAVSSRNIETTFVFTHDGATWAEESAIYHPLPGPFDEAGRALALEPGLLLVGAPRDDETSPHSDDGAVFAKMLVGGMCAADAECGGGLCSHGFCCDERCAGPCARCDGDGSEGRCMPARHGFPGEPACGLFLCDGVDHACPTECAFDTDCSEGSFCNLAMTPPTCQATGALGAPCETTDQCDGGVCTDGVCCSSSCTESCARCDVQGSEGTCTPVPTGTPGGCAPLVCDGVSPECPETCTDENCADGFICNHESGQCTSAAFCLDSVTLQQTDGTVQGCERYRCSDGRCMNTCVTSVACAPGFVCNAAKACAPAPESRAVDACACRAAGAPRTAPWPLLLLALAGCRRRRGRA